MRFPSGPASIEVDEIGSVTSVVHRARPGRSYLAELGVGPVVLEGSVVPVDQARVRADADEVEVVRRHGDLEVSLRHTFAAGWGMRLAVANLGPDTLSVDSVQVTVVPDAGVGWVLAAGAEASYLVLPEEVAGPVLGGRLRLGALQVAAAGLAASGLRLDAGARYVVHWQWDWVPTPARWGRAAPSVVPETSLLAPGQTAVIGADQDVALTVSGEGVGRHRSGDRHELVAYAPTLARVQAAGPGGVVGYDLEWVRSVADLLSDAAVALLQRPRTPAGVARLEGVAEGLLVQHLMSTHDGSDAAAEEALDLLTDRLLLLEPSDPLVATYLCREHDRTPDPTLLLAAEAVLRAVSECARPARGLGVALAHLTVGSLARGVPLRVSVRVLRERVAAWPSVRTFSERTAHLEVSTVLAARVVATADAALVEQVRGLGAHLGGGCQGEPVRPLSTADLSHLLTVFRMLPESVSAATLRIWGCTAAALAERTVPALVARLVAEPDPDALAWLVLGDPVV